MAKLQEWHDGNKERYKRSRRAMTEFRTEEFLAAVESMISLNTQNIEALESIGLSFVGKLNTTEIHYMGHSFGGSTSMHASLRGRPPTSVIAHEPVADWLPDQTRYSLFEKQRLEGTNYTNLIVREDTATAATGGPSIHDRNMLLLFSNEWHTKEWGYIPVFKDMDERKQLGPKGGVSRVQVIDGANHNEFSDTSMLTPTWLAREVGLTGPRNPLDTAWDIHEATMDFLNQVRVQSR